MGDADTTVGTINEILREAGVEPDLQVLSYNANRNTCSITLQKPGGIVQKSFPDSIRCRPDILNFISDEYARIVTARTGHPPAAKFFTTIDNWIFVETDGKPPPDQFLRLTGEGWGKISLDFQNHTPEMTRNLLSAYKAYKKSPAPDPAFLQKMEEVLSKVTWEDLGLQVSAARFKEESYAFDVRSNPKSPLNFFDGVTLAGHPDISIPRSDPYLYMSWIKFMQEAGCGMVEEGHTKELPDSYGAVWYFKGQKVVTVEFTKEKARHVRFFNPLGERVDEVILPSRSRPAKVVVTPPKETKDPVWWVTVHGKKLAVEIYFPKNLDQYPLATEQQEWTMVVQDIGEQMQKIPPSMLAPLLNGIGDEAPVRIVVSTREKARELGLEKRSNVAGHNDVDKNRIWLNFDAISKDIRLGPILHELGHTLADFMVPEDNTGTIVDPDRSALRDYYNLKLMQIFPPNEIDSKLTTYDRLSAQLAKLQQESNPDQKEIDKLEKELKLFRVQAYQVFESAYAVEGSGGIGTHMERPAEDFAEVAATFLSGLVGGDWGVDEGRVIQMHDPLWKLMGLKYLFDEYKVPSIGHIRRDEIFSKKAFGKVLGIPLDGKEYTGVKKILDPHKDPHKEGWVVGGGASIEFSSKGAAGGFYLKGEYRQGHWGVKAHFSGDVGSKEGTRFSGSVGPAYYFGRASSAGLYVDLPAVGLSYRPGADTPRSAALLVYPVGVGVRVPVTSRLSLDGRIRTRIDLPLDGRSRPTAGVEIPLGVEWNF